MFYESDEEMVEEDEMDNGEYETTEEEEKLPQTNNKITILDGVPWFHTLRLKGVQQGHRITILVDGGAIHNFIDVSLVEKRKIPTNSFEGFTVVIP